MLQPCATSTSTCCSFAVISSDLYLFLGMSEVEGRPYDVTSDIPLREPTGATAVIGSPEGVALATGHKARQIGLAFDHLFGRIPIGPFRQPGNAFTARPSEAFAADPNAVTQSLAVAEHEIEIGVRRVDDDRAGRLLGVVIDQGATELRRQFLPRAGFGPHLGRQRRDGSRIVAHQSGRQGIDLTGTGCAGVGSTASRQIVIIVGLSWRKWRIARKWIIPRHRSKANQKTRDDNCRAESHPLSPHTSIDAQRGTFKDAAVKSLTSLSVGSCLPLAPLASRAHNR